MGLPGEERFLSAVSVNTLCQLERKKKEGSNFFFFFFSPAKPPSYKEAKSVMLLKLLLSVRILLTHSWHMALTPVAKVKCNKNRELVQERVGGAA